MFKILFVTLKSSVKRMYFHLLCILSSVKSRNDLSWLQFVLGKIYIKEVTSWTGYLSSSLHGC